MSKPKQMASAIALAFLTSAATQANEGDEIAQLRAEIQQMKQNYEARIQALETRLQETESVAGQAVKTAETASIQVSGKTISSNVFNPDISLILSGIYANRTQDSNYHLTGFQSGGEIGPGGRGFSLGESELGLYANIDPLFYGGLNLALVPDNTVGVEEAFVQTTSLPANFTLKGGRFFSGIGYLNEKHAHVWDFVDNPLVYQAFLGNQLGEDGVQLKWLAPTDQFLELGVEYGRGRIADTGGRDKNGGGAGTFFGHISGDVGVSNSWRAGASYLEVSPEGRLSNDLDGTNAYVTNSFTGEDKILVGDFVWKWAPNGNTVNRSFTVQGEYLQRKEEGLLNADVYTASQSGWYLQAVYKLARQWRTGLRYDQLNSGSLDYGLNTSNLVDGDYDPNRVSWMLDYTPSEFSRLRLQFARDESREEATDNQVYVQYLMSLGAHGAHKY